MAYGSLISITHASEDGRNITVLLEQEGYVGSPFSASVKLGIPAYSINFDADESSEIDSLGAQVHFVTSDSALIAILQAMRFGDERDGRVTIKVGSAVVFQGYVIPDAVSVPLTEQITRTITIGAKDRSRSLDEEWLSGGNPYTGDIVASVLIADILASTGIPFTEIRALQTWRPGRLAFSGDPYSIKIPARNLYEYGDDGSVRARSKKWVLEQILGLTLSRLVQWGGAWYITQPSSHFSAEVVGWHIYNASGAHTATSHLGAYIDLTGSEWLKDTDEGRSRPSYRRADATYAFGEINQQLTNGQFALWNGNTPRGWTPANARTWQAIGRTDFASVALEGVDLSTLAIPTTDEDAAVGFIEQSIQVSLTANSYELRAYAAFGVFQFQDGAFREYTDPFGTPDRIRSYISIRLVNGADVYYLKTDGTWTIAGGAEVKHEVQPERVAYQRVVLEMDDVPATGTLFIRLYQAVHTNIQLSGGLNPHAEGVVGAALWDDVEMAIVELEDEGAQAITYGVYDSSKVEGKTYERVFVIGDGPFVSSPGAIKYPDGTVTGDWRPLANATEAFAITELTAREFMRGFRNAQATIAFTLASANLNVTPVTAYKYGSRRYWPISLAIEQPTGRATILAREIRDDGVPPDSDVRREERIQVSRAAEGVAVYADLNPRIQNAFALSSHARTSAVIKAGTRSSIPINPVDSIFPATTPITLVDSRTGNSVDLTVSDNYGRFEPTLRIEPFAFTQDFDTGSYIIIAPAHALHRIAITENAFNRTMRAGRICALTSAVAGTVTSLAVTPTRRDIAKDTVLVIVEGLTGSTDVSDDEQTVQVSAFTKAGVSAIPIVSQRVDAPSGAHLTEDNQQLWSFFLQNPDKIQLGVERKETGTGITTLTAAVSGAAVTSLSVTALPSAVKSGDRYEVIHKRTGHTVLVTLSADAAETDTTIAINSANFSTAGSAFPIGSRVRLADRTTRSELLLHDGQISAIVSTTDGHTAAIASLDLRVTDNEATVVLKAEVTAGKITKLATVALSASVAGGSAITLAANQINIDGTTTFSAGFDPSTKETPAGAQAKADAAQTAAAITAAGYTDAEIASFSATLGGLAFEDLVGAALLDSTVIVGGFIKTSLLTADNIVVGTMSGARINASTAVVAGSGNNVGVLSGADATYRIWAGHATAASAPFRVTQAGALTATSATITGTITSSNVTITGGTLNIGSGAFVVTSGGALTATSATITGTITSSNVTITGGTLNIGSGAFVVTSGGALTATSATITGAITATSGSLSGLTVSGTLTMGAGGEITAGNVTISASGIASTSAGTVSSFSNAEVVVTNSGLSQEAKISRVGLTVTEGANTTVVRSTFIQITGNTVWHAGNFDPTQYSQRKHTESGTTPSSPSVGDTWWDSGNDNLKMYANGSWRVISA